MKPYMKIFLSFLLGVGCLYFSTVYWKDKDQQAMSYFLFIVAIVNIYIGVKDLITIYKKK